MIPLFTSHYSKGRSILTLADPDDAKEGGSDSIVKLCIDNGIENPFIVENNLTGLAEAFKNFGKHKIKFRFGWKTEIVNDLSSEEKDNTKSKIILFIKNTKGYYDLIKLHNQAQKSFGGLVDSSFLKEHMTSNLLVGVPFYDSYIFNNILFDSISQPNVKQFDPVFFREDNGLPFDHLVSSRLPEGRVVDAKSIYYNRREDFEAWQVYKCLSNLMNKGKKRSINLPMFEHCCSREFCLESWKEKL